MEKNGASLEAVCRLQPGVLLSCKELTTYPLYDKKICATFNVMRWLDCRMEDLNHGTE